MYLRTLLAAATQATQGPPPSTGVGLIQLAINSSSCSIANYAAAVAAKFSAAHVPDVARKLLLTAATRGHAAALHSLASCSPVQQCLDAHTVENMIAQLIKGNNPDGFKLLCKLPAAQQLESTAVVRLLQAALQQRRGFVEGLMECPAMQQLSADMVVQLLQALLDSTSAQSNRFSAEICIRQEAQRSSSREVEQLLLDAKDRNSLSSCDTCMEALYRLPSS
jgi:hypothetical protein